MINLFTTYYNEKNSERDDELKECLNINSKLEAINNIYALSEIEKDDFLLNNDINVIRIFERPTFNKFFDSINEVTSNDDINVISNSDIYFDESLNRLNEINLTNFCFALTRWDVWNDGRARLTEISESQDCWIFKGKINIINANIKIGIPGCDNRLAYEIKEAGYNLTNPSISIRAYHLHISEYRPNKKNWFFDDYSIGPPHESIMPDTIASSCGHGFFNMLKTRNEILEYLYSIKIKRWYKYKTEYKNYILAFEYKIPKIVKYYFAYIYYRLPWDRLLIKLISPVYYRDVIKR